MSNVGIVGQIKSLMKKKKKKKKTLFIEDST